MTFESVKIYVSPFYIGALKSHQNVLNVSFWHIQMNMSLSSKMTLSIQCVTLSEYVMVLNVSFWANVSLWNDTFTESDRFKSCFFIICQEILISQNAESVTTFFLKVSLLTNVSLLNVSLLTNVSKKTNVSLKSDWFSWKCHFLWHIHWKVTHSKPVEWYE